MKEETNNSDLESDWNYGGCPNNNSDLERFWNFLNCEEESEGGGGGGGGGGGEEEEEGEEEGGGEGEEEEGEEEVEGDEGDEEDKEQEQEGGGKGKEGRITKILFDGEGEEEEGEEESKGGGDEEAEGEEERGGSEGEEEEGEEEVEGDEGDEEDKEQEQKRGGKGKEARITKILFDGIGEEEEGEEESEGGRGEEEEGEEEREGGSEGEEEEGEEEVEGDEGDEEDEQEHQGGGEGEDSRITKILFDGELPLLPPPKRPRNQSLDQISTLRDSILLHILSFLPMKEVVRTGTLSKRWQFLWTSVSTLVFENFDFEENEIRKFVAYVNHTLLLCRRSNFNKFVVDFRYKKCFSPDVNIWIRLAMQNNVEDLYLRLGFSRVEPDGYRLPQHLFTNSSLTILSLMNCIVAPSGDVSWRLLKSLSIEYVKLTDEVIAKILAGCPVLEFLKINSFSGISRLDINSASLKKLVIQLSLVGRDDEYTLEISAPHLQSLELLGSFHRRKFCLVHVPSLVKANLNFTFGDNSGRDSNYDYEKQLNQLRELLERLQHVKELQLGTWCIQVLSRAEVKSLPSPMSSCKMLTLYTHIKKWDLPGIARLLQSSPYLETLVVDMSSLYHQRFRNFLNVMINSYNFNGENYWTSHKRISERSLLHLKTIKIVGFREVCEVFVLQLVQFLLENAKVLEKMVIKTGKFSYNQCSACSVSKEFVQLTQKLLISFPRASPRAVVMIS